MWHPEEGKLRAVRSGRGGSLSGEIGVGSIV